MTIARFWREMDSRYNLVGSKCGHCGKYYFPRRIICPDCHRLSIGKMQDYKFKGTGTIVSFTVIHESYGTFKMDVPYIMGIIQLDEGPRLTAQIIDCKATDIQIGMKVEATFRKLSEDGKAGIIHYGYKFRKVNFYKSKI